MVKIMQQSDLSDPTQLILLVIGLILTALILYLAVRIIAGKKELDGGYLIDIQTGPRKDILKIERELVETNPGPLNKEPWAGSRKGQ